MLTINYFVIAIMLLTISLLIYLLYFSFNSFHLSKPNQSVKRKKRSLRKRRAKQHRVRIEKMIKGIQLIIGLALTVVLLLTFIILKVESQSNQLLQSNYNVLNNQVKLEKKIETQDRILDKLTQLKTYPEEGLSSFKIISGTVLQEEDQKKFIEQLNEELEPLFPNCKITIELNSNLKRLIFNLEESEVHIELDRQNRKVILECFKVELAELNFIDEFMINETLFEKSPTEKIYIKNRKGEFVEQEVGS